MRSIAITLSWLSAAVFAQTLAAQAPVPVPAPVPMPTPAPRAVKEFPDGFPYSAFDVQDSLQRRIAFYLTDANVKDDRPLILILQGSGCASNFLLREGRVGGSWHAMVRQAAQSRAQVLLVDKPGVSLFDFPTNPGDTRNCSDAFRREHTGPRWLTALAAAVKGAISLRGQTPKSILVIGHSEGAVFAPRLALLQPEITHVASLASAPVSQLHDFFDMAFAGEGFIAQMPGTAQDRVRRVSEAWRAISSDPDSASKEVFGHPHRYWTDKFASFPFENVDRTKAKFFLAYGDRDENSAPRKMDMFAVELLTRNRDLTWIRVPGADHGFAKKGEASGEGMAPMLARAVAWFFGEADSGADVVWPSPVGGRKPKASS
jgi:pimeloyl-ACP methyl ester carboxylesterase